MTQTNDCETCDGRRILGGCGQEDCDHHSLDGRELEEEK